VNATVAACAPFHPGLFETNDGSLRLIASRCRSCGRYAFPSKRFCSACHSGDAETVHLKGMGRVYAFTHVALPPKSMGGPYVAAYIDMDEGVRIFAQIADADVTSLRIGDRMKVDFRQAPGTEVGLVAYAFVPAKENAA
jgi:hypothetical protein